MMKAFFRTRIAVLGLFLSAFFPIAAFGCQGDTRDFHVALQVRRTPFGDFKIGVWTTPKPDVPSTQPTLPEVSMFKINRTAGATARDVGLQLTRTGPAVLRDAYVTGYHQNIVCERATRLDIANVVSVDAYSPAQYEGQSLYVDHVPVVKIDTFYGARAGWQPGKPTWQRSVYKHSGGYFNFGAASVDIGTMIIVGSSGPGLEVRGPGTHVIQRLMCIDCGIGAQFIGGPVYIREAICYESGWYVEPGGKPPTAANGSNVGGPALVFACPAEIDALTLLSSFPDPSRVPVRGRPVVRMPGVVLDKHWAGEGGPDHERYHRPPAGFKVHVTHYVRAGYGIGASGGDNVDAFHATSYVPLDVPKTQFRYTDVTSRIERGEMSVDAGYAAIRAGLQSIVRF